MTRNLGIALLLTALATALGVYVLKDRVLQLEAELGRTRTAVAAERSVLGRLRTEWAMLNHPGRLARLAGSHLGLQPARPRQIVRIADLPLRAELELKDREWVVTLPSGAPGSLRLKPAKLLMATLPQREAAPQAPP